MRRRHQRARRSKRSADAAPELGVSAAGSVLKRVLVWRLQIGPLRSNNAPVRCRLRELVYTLTDGACSLDRLRRVVHRCCVVRIVVSKPIVAVSQPGYASRRASAGPGKAPGHPCLSVFNAACLSVFSAFSAEKTGEAHLSSTERFVLFSMIVLICFMKQRGSCFESLGHLYHTSVVVSRQTLGKSAVHVEPHVHYHTCIQLYTFTRVFNCTRSPSVTTADAFQLETLSPAHALDVSDRLRNSAPCIF